MKTSLKTAMAAFALVGSLTLAGCAPAAETPGESTALAGLTGVVGAKDFSEQYILGNMVSLLLNANGAETTYQTIVGSANVRTALESDEFMGYWEYTGTSWLAYLGNDKGVPGVQAQYDAVKAADGANGIAWLNGAAVNNTYAFAIRSEKAAELGIKTMSDVAMLPESEQTFCIESEFAARPDGWEGFKSAYGLKGKTVTLDTGAIYSVTDKGEDCNFGEVFATDGRIKALDLIVMQDDKEYFPVYQIGFTLKQTTLDKYPALADIINKLTATLTDEVMQTLNARADVDGDEPADIAREYLIEKGFLTE
jgi:osmoprotectant transport system substrate-binding protein